MPIKTRQRLKLACAVLLSPLLLISNTSQASEQDPELGKDGFLIDPKAYDEIDLAINHLITRQNNTPPPINQNYYTQYAQEFATVAATPRQPFKYYDPVLGKEIVINPQTGNRTPSTQSLSAISLSDNSAPSLAARAATRVAKSSSIGWCALYVRKALQAAGYKITPQPSAYMYANGTLANAGFKKISNKNYRPQVGDVMVFNRTPKNPHGHIQIFNGSIWVSDFKQNTMMIYGNNHRGYSVWRDSRYIDASDSGRTMLAHGN